MRRILTSNAYDSDEQDANLVHYSGYSEKELKPTAQLMLDYIVRTSPSLTRWAASAAEDGEVENPLEMSPADYEHEHPNFIKKYGAKKVRRRETSGQPRGVELKADPNVVACAVLQSFDGHAQVG